MIKSICFSACVLIFTGTALQAAGTFETALRPHVISDPERVYDPNQNSDPMTGLKPGYTWRTDLNPVAPEHDMWITSEHALVQTGTDRWMLVAMEHNWSQLVYGPYPWLEAFNFVEWDNTGFPETPTLPSSENGYWRGGDDGDEFTHVWAPSVFEEAGTYYMYYPARIPDTLGGKVYPFLATSTTGDADPSAWTQYDPDPMTPESEPLFEVQGTDKGGRDYFVIKADTGSGFEYRMYFCVDVFYSGLGVYKNETWMRTSANLIDWNDSTEVTVFDFVNVGGTHPSRYLVDYENPNVIQHPNGDYYLFLSRHSQYPADWPNPGWEIIPLSTEVFWSADGLTFDPAHKLPNLTHKNGSAINSTEILRDGNRWYATDATDSNNTDHWLFNDCEDPPGSGNYTCFDGFLTQYIPTREVSSHQLRLVEFIWTNLENPSTATSWELYN